MAAGMLSLGTPTRTGFNREPLRVLLAPNNRCSKGRRLSAPSAFGGVGPLAASGIVSIATTFITSATVAIGALILSQRVTLEQDRLDQREACPSCGGSGYEPCFCTRWSDGDVGCNSCGHTGYKECKNCGGGGTAVPIPIAIRKNDQNRMG